DDELTLTQTSIGPSRIEAATNNEGGVQVTSGQHACHQAGGGGLAVGTRNRNTTLQSHQLGQHEGSRHNGNAGSAGSQHFRVICANGGRYDDRANTLHVLCV